MQKPVRLPVIITTARLSVAPYARDVEHHAWVDSEGVDHIAPDVHNDELIGSIVYMKTGNVHRTKLTADQVAELFGWSRPPVGADHALRSWLRSYFEKIGGFAATGRSRENTLLKVICADVQKELDRG